VSNTLSQNSGENRSATLRAFSKKSVSGGPFEFFHFNTSAARQRLKMPKRHRYHSLGHPSDNLSPYFGSTSVRPFSRVSRKSGFLAAILELHERSNIAKNQHHQAPRQPRVTLSINFGENPSGRFHAAGVVAIRDLCDLRGDLDTQKTARRNEKPRSDSESARKSPPSGGTLVEIRQSPFLPTFHCQTGGASNETQCWESATL
jgi:hypothetical protein